MPFSPPAAPPPLPPPHSSEVDLRRCRRLFLLLTLQLQLHLRPSGARGRPSHAPARCSVRLSPQARRQWHRFTSSLDVAMNSVAVLGDGEGEITAWLRTALPLPDDVMQEQELPPLLPYVFTPQRAGWHFCEKALRFARNSAAVLHEQSHRVVYLRLGLCPKPPTCPPLPARLLVPPVPRLALSLSFSRLASPPPPPPRAPPLLPLPQPSSSSAAGPFSALHRLRCRPPLPPSTPRVAAPIPVPAPSLGFRHERPPAVEASTFLLILVLTAAAFAA
uniref:Uncharacterized protein n=1 Tax=Oryza sativa subsp. japonica TaxID=39947 RepID=Q5Z4H2_ORYSJ|nr:hypothetical protein [Oryza sativa Japonica Group]BAD62360.1 hypothetical protein [Oryza sativa Japonica Group]